MKKTLILVMIALGFGLGWYGQYQKNPNVWLSCAAVIIFMMGMMWLSSKTPSKHTEAAHEADTQDLNERDQDGKI